MSDKYVGGEVVVAFKPEADVSEIERILDQFPHEKVFPDEQYDPQASRDDQILARLYTFKCQSEEDFLKKLREKHNELIEYAHKPPTRKLID